MNARSVHDCPCGDRTRSGGALAPSKHRTSCQVEIRATFADLQRVTWECQMSIALADLECMGVMEIPVPLWFWREVLQRLLEALDEPATPEVAAP